MFSDAYQARNFPVVRPDWLGLVEEPVLDPQRTIIDAHHHLWDVTGSVYHARDLATDMATGHNVVATVMVEAKSRYRPHGPVDAAPLGETEFAVSQAGAAGSAHHRLCAAIVGWVDLRQGERVRPLLEAHVQAGDGRFRGVRLRAAWHADGELHPAGEGQPGLLLDPAVQHAARCLADLSLTLDVWAFHTQLPEVAQLAAACPQTTIILNHCGGPLGIGPFAGQRQAVFREWRAHMLQLAKHDNVVVKLGGLGMPRMGFAFDHQPQPPDSDALATAWRPYIDACIDAFGARRCLFESNFPVDKGMCSYAVLWNAFKRIAAGCSDAEKADLFAGTAARCYRIET